MKALLYILSHLGVWVGQNGGSRMGSFWLEVLPCFALATEVAGNVGAKSTCVDYVGRLI